ncbi:MAG: choice-of-anchor D domain-containing protein [Comamonadaceae bacterium]|nr:choice-of-anchor D domain-containing protein [Comamonadaceae bacterium]
MRQGRPARCSGATVEHLNNSGGNVTINLNGTGVNNTPAISLTYHEFNGFGAVQVGQTSAARSVTVTNTGGGRRRSPGSRCQAVRVHRDGLRRRQPVEQPVVHDQRDLRCRPRPVLPAPRCRSRTMPLAARRRWLSGTGSAVALPVVSLSRPSVTFAGVLALNQSLTNERVVFSNAGPGSVTIGALTLTGDFLAVAGGAGAARVERLEARRRAVYASIDLRFTPTAAGECNGTLTVASGGTPADAVSTLTGTGSAVAALAISAPAQLDFGKLPVELRLGRAAVDDHQLRIDQPGGQRAVAVASRSP